MRNAGEEPTIIEYLKSEITEKELTDVLAKLQISAEELVRKGEAIFKEEYKGKSLTEKEWIKAMVEHPKLIERPIVIKGNQAVLGRPPQKVLELIKK